ncbi:MAG: hypothetical protein Q4F24_16070 [Eubacteriales bacterium]|nr:hypothetical protein [Eubacteriales bacterium]
MLKTAMIFGNHMTLQRQKPIRVWGRADSGVKVHIILEPVGRSAEATADESGIWGKNLM